MVGWMHSRGPLVRLTLLWGLMVAVILGQSALSVCCAAGTVVAWGADDSLQSEPPLGLSNVTAVAGGEDHSLALKADGTVVAWGFNLSGQTNVPANLTSVAAIAAGSTYSLALRSNGTLVAWGAAPPGLTNTQSLSNFTAIASGWFHALALNRDGMVTGWGASSNLPPAGLTNVVAIAGGKNFSLALLADSTVKAWGDNSFGQTNVPAGLSNVIAIAAGSAHCLALKRDSSVVAWGRNDAGQATVPTNLVAVAIGAGALHSLALRRDATLTAWGDNLYGQTVINTNIGGFTMVSCGGYHNLAVKGDGSPFILLQPFSQSVPLAQSATFQVIVTGNLPLSYQWQRSGTNIPSTTAFPTTASALFFPYLLLSDAGTYQVVVANNLGTVTSLPVTLTPVPVPPYLTTQPQSQTNLCGASATFFVVAGGPTNITYQWQFYGTNLPGQTATNLLLGAISPADQGPYTLVASNPYGSITSVVASLTVITVPTVTVQPHDTNVFCGRPASFQTAATGPVPISYQWQFGGAAISGATNSTYAISAAISKDAGPYSVVVSCPCGAITSAVALLTVSNTPAISRQPADTNVFCGRPVALQVQTASPGPTPLNYQWLFQGAPMAGATASRFALPAVTADNDGYFSVVVACPCGAVTSAVARVSVNLLPIITSDPTNQTVFCGDTTNFVVAAAGPAEPTPLSYQWQFGGVPIPGATNTILTLSGVLTNQAGLYSAVVAGPCGAVTSAVATLTVNIQPPFITSPLTAGGKQGVPFSYQITGQNGPTSFSAHFLPAGLTNDPATGLISGTPLDSGTFGVVIGDANACAADSETLVLSITSSVPVITSPLVAMGGSGTAFGYTITATESPTYYDAQNLPPGLVIDPFADTNQISGFPAYAGDFYTVIYAGNQWGAGSNLLHIIITNGPINGLSITEVTTNYSTPYLLDFFFSLRDDNDPTVGKPLVVDTSLLSAAGFEDTTRVDTNETALILAQVRPDSLRLRVNLVLDFTASMSSPLINGDTNHDGISDTVDTELASAETFCIQQSPTTQIGVYEFHRDDVAPNQVSGLTNKTAAANAIAGIWTNYVNFFYSGSRCFDALDLAVKGFTANSNEQHVVVFVSDGLDDASTTTLQQVITDATNNAVRIYCIGFGPEIATNVLEAIATNTLGAFYTGSTVTDLAAEFAEVSKVLSGKYHLRWATTRRNNKSFLPSFQITYQGITATSPPNPIVTIIGTNYTWVDTNSTPPVTNGPTLIDYSMVSNYIIIDQTPAFATNYIIAPYTPTLYAGNILGGKLQLMPNPNAVPYGLTLYADYIPRNIRQFRFHYRPNWPCAMVASTNVGDLLYGWSVAPASDGTNGTWLLLSSPDPYSAGGIPTSIPYASFGSLLNFNFRDAVIPNTAFAFFVIDTNLYAPTNGIPGYVGQYFTNNPNGNLTNFPALPHGTPVPWLLSYGITGNFTNAELADPDGDGIATWQEYQANTSPTNASSKFVFGPLLRRSDGRFQLAFASSLNRSYTLLSSTDLNSMTWDVVQANLPGTGTNLTIIDTRFLPTTQLYYRVQVQ